MARVVFLNVQLEALGKRSRVDVIMRVEFFNRRPQDCSIDHYVALEVGHDTWNSQCPMSHPTGSFWTADGNARE